MPDIYASITAADAATLESLAGPRELRLYERFSRQTLAADVSVKKFRVPVLRAREYAIATAQVEMARIAAWRLATLPFRWSQRSVVSSQRSAAIALCFCPFSLMPCLPPWAP